MTVNLKRSSIILKPSQSRVLLRPFTPGDSERVAKIIERVMALPEDQVASTIEQVRVEFAGRHQNGRRLVLERFQQIREMVKIEGALTEGRQILIGSYFLAEYALESAALFNPSIVPHPDQSDLPPGALRFILSLRAIGEGHISSITFRTGIIHPDHRIEVLTPTEFLTEPRHIPNALYEKPLFGRKLHELGLLNDFAHRVLNRLGETFTLDELRGSIAGALDESRSSDGTEQEDQRTGHGILLLARSNFEVHFEPEQRLSERIIFPATPSQRNGIEDARFVYFKNDDGKYSYYATFSAYDGRVVVPELMETSDFLRFRFFTLNGPAAQNKGMALFPRKINGSYVMLSRQDNENIYIMHSDNVHFWNETRVLLKPAFSWEMIQLGNCGSPIETRDGWLVLSHGVGPIRKYCIGAFLLDLDDPSRVIGRLREPLLTPNQDERVGYVPNVVYTCGALVHDGELIVPYGLSDSATGFASAPLDDVLAAIHKDNH